MSVTTSDLYVELVPCAHEENINMGSIGRGQEKKKCIQAYSG